MLRVALTGGIGTGKTTVLGYLRERGVPTIESDTIAHRVIAAGTSGAAAIAARFGPDVLTPAGDVDRPRLAALVFSNADARRDLERIVHPSVYGAIDAWMDVRAAEGVDVAVAEIPLLFETGHESDFDCVVVTTCEEDEQIRRIVERGREEADARGRIAAQLPLAEKARRADVVIRTDGTLEDTLARTEAALRTLRAMAAGQAR